MSVTVPGSVVLVVVEVELLLDVEVLVLDVFVEVVLLVVLLVDELLVELLEVVLLVDDDVLVVLLEVVLEVDVVDVAPGTEVLVLELLDVVVVVELVVLVEDVAVDDEVVEEELVDAVLVVDDDVVDVVVPAGGSRAPATAGGDCPGSVVPLLKKIVLNAPARHPGWASAAISARLVAAAGSPSASWPSTLPNACAFVSPASRRSRIAQP